ncbi:MAG TPA: 50S ribosomal protein L4 [Victivallales bacterium]|nr:50S ribosomal protein L4 [Victivallales bacterium]
MNNQIILANIDGTKAESMQIDQSKIELKKGEQAVHDAITAYLASLHRPTASTKTRSNIRGGGCKPFRQKGLGRARAGTIRSPLWRHGAITFGPLPEKNYKKCLNKKVLKLALKRAFSERLNENSIIACEKIDIQSGKTKDAMNFLNKIGAGTNVLIISDSLSENSLRAFRNIPELNVQSPKTVNTYDILLHQKVLFDKDAIEQFLKRI